MEYVHPLSVIFLLKTQKGSFSSGIPSIYIEKEFRNFLYCMVEETASMKKCHNKK